MSGSQLGISGRIARSFLTSQLTPLLALTGLLLGLFAVAVTPKEEEPQIDVTMANVLVPFPGASAHEVENLVATPAEQVLGEIDGVEHTYSTSTPGMALITVQFEVGVPRQEALVKLYNQVWSNADWLPANLGTLTPIVKPKGIDDVPIMALTLSSSDPAITATDLADVAHTLETELKRVPGTRDIYTLGAPDDIVRVTLDPARLAAYDIDFGALRASLVTANRAMSPTQVVQDGRNVEIRAGDFFRSTDDVAALIVGTRGSQPVYLADVADIARAPDTPARSVLHWQRPAGAAAGTTADLRPAVTIAIAKQPGENAIDITEKVQARMAALDNIAIPAGIEISISRNYGQTAADKSAKLIQKLLFATFAVVALVFFALGRREAFIVGSAVIITLAVTLFASWAWGFTLNRVSLFALIFSIGILVDDAIVVVENIHRQMALPQNAGKSLVELIPGAVDEVGAPTILATFTVIAALMPMAFVSGLMGPYMSPIPINASTGMLISLAIAFVITPWMAAKYLQPHPVHGHAGESGLDRFFASLAQKLLAPLVAAGGGRSRRHRLYGSVLAAIAFAVTLPVLGLVVLKMLPFDNKSEFQVIVDMPEGTPVEDTRRVLAALADELKSVPEVVSLQVYAGTSAPINFNGLVRQYYLRSGAHMGDIQVNLADKHHRDRASHEIALAVRAPLQIIGNRLGANVKIVEVPPGPPVLSPIVAEIYGYDEAGRLATAEKVRATLTATPDVVDIDDTLATPAPRVQYMIDRQKAARLGLEYAQVVQAISSLTGGDDVSYLHDGSAKFAVPIRLALADADKADPAALLALKLAAADGRMIALGEVVRATPATIEQPVHHKDLLPVVYVTADVAGSADSPLYGMFRAAGALGEKHADISQTYFAQPGLPVTPAVKWDGEWQVTWETFRDMGLAYGVGMILIYLLVVGQFGSYTVPLVIMAPIPLTVIGVMPGHALFGAQFTATSMIGMIALAGIIVRNSILLVDFTNEQLRAGMKLEDAIVSAAAVRAKPILLTAFAAIIGALFILDDPIFNGLAIALIFGIFVSSLLTLVVIPVLYYIAMREKPARNPRTPPGWL
ncbi:MAG: efflux RND transporter permease subunit [Pseudomonadota bacterium]